MDFGLEGQRVGAAGSSRPGTNPTARAPPTMRKISLKTTPKGAAAKASAPTTTAAGATAEAPRPRLSAQQRTGTTGAGGLAAKRTSHITLSPTKTSGAAGTAARKPAGGTRAPQTTARTALTKPPAEPAAAATEVNPTAAGAASPSVKKRTSRVGGAGTGGSRRGSQIRQDIEQLQSEFFNANNYVAAEPNTTTSNIYNNNEGASAKRRASKGGGMLLMDDSLVINPTSTANLAAPPSLGAAPGDPSSRGSFGARQRSGSQLAPPAAASTAYRDGTTVPAHEVKPDICAFYYNQPCSNVNYYCPHERVVLQQQQPEGQPHDDDDDDDDEEVAEAAVVTEEDAYNNCYAVTPGGLAPAWRSGPTNPEGGLYDASDANLLCMDVLNTNNVTSSFSQGSQYNFQKHRAGGPLCVVGGADHGLKVFDLYHRQTVRKLYNKQYGHTEWVTTVKFLNDGRIVSGGMDSRICLWDSMLGGGGAPARPKAGGSGSSEAQPYSYGSSNAPARCAVLDGHTASISQIEVNAANSFLLSASYDRSMRLFHIPAYFSISEKRKESAVLTGGHNAAITHFSWNYNFVLSGDKKGILKVWDLMNQKAVQTLATKKGAVTALRGLAVPPPRHSVGAQSHHYHSCFIGAYGDMTGTLSVVDLREGGGGATSTNKIFHDVVHPGGALTDIHFLYPSPSPQDMTAIPLVATCGADQRIHVLEPRKNFQPLFSFTEAKDFIYSMNPLSVLNKAHDTFEHLLFSGTGDGSLYVYDVQAGRCCYGLGANAAAVRCVAALPGLLATAGDDGKAMVYYY